MKIILSVLTILLISAGNSFAGIITESNDTLFESNNSLDIDSDGSLNSRRDAVTQKDTDVKKASSYPKDQYLPEYKRKKFITSDGVEINSLEDLRKIVPEDHKDIENRKAGDLGTLAVFVDVSSMSEKVAKDINKISELKQLQKFFFLKQVKSTMSFMTLAAKTSSSLEVSLSLDSGDKNARKLHVTRYPSMVYITPDKSKFSYSVSSGGLGALKMKILEEKEKIRLAAEQAAANN